MLPNPSTLNLNYTPDKWRDGQVKAIDWLQEDSWLEKPYYKREVKVLEAPTGTGKTGLILGLAALNPELRFLILCATKIEQDQYMQNLKELDPEITVVKGKNNYHCKKEHPWLDSDIEVCTEAECDLLHVHEALCEAGLSCEFKVDQSCHYYEKKRSGRNARVVIGNYALGLAILNYSTPFFGVGKFDVIVEDEGHVLDVQLEQFIMVKLSRKTVERLFYIRLPNFDSIPPWSSWVKDNWKELEEVGRGLEIIGLDNLSPEEAKKLLAINSYLDKFEKISEMNTDWVVEETKFGVEFQPVWVTGDSREVLFNHAKRHIIMSGTIPSAKELGKKIGLRLGDFEFFRLPYTFPPENRPIILNPQVSLSRDNLDRNLPALIRAVDKTLEEYAGVKALIHTKTYKITQYIKEHSAFSEYMFTHTTADRNSVLAKFKKASAPAILVSPSFDKAIDLPGDECELIIIAKIPYPYLGTKVMQKRVKQSRSYYAHETLMGVIQMAGRGVRSEVDVCPTVILDLAGPMFMNQVRSMTPKGIREAIRIKEK
jgi:Rad3-related DNA helicase